MSIPPEREPPAWAVAGDRPSPRERAAASHKPDRAGMVLVGCVLVALVVGLVLVVVL